MDFIQKCLDCTSEGHLTIGGLDTVELARTFGTPAYIMDEEVIRARCGTYLKAMREHFSTDSIPLYASKALSFKRMYQIMQEMGMGIDVVSPGELYTAAEAGFPLSRAYFHGNNKTDRDIELAREKGIGCFVADNREELDAIEKIYGEAGENARVMLRVTPGIDPHTFKAVRTGQVDSKFGAAIQTGQALELVKHALGKRHIAYVGLHCHIGSQIFDSQPFFDAAKIMMAFIAEILKETGAETDELNLGGGFGVRYVETHENVDYAKNIEKIGKMLHTLSKEYGVKLPKILMEPGRSIVADAGITLYEVGSVKQITGFKNYVSIDGGMPDNPRYALYQSPYDAVIANRADTKRDFLCTIAGRCCESGDLIQEDILLQRPVRGDILAVLVTGAYNYSMASNYNRIPRPPVIMISEGKPYVAVKRESFEDLIRNDV